MKPRTNQPFAQRAFAAVEQLAAERPAFTSDDAWSHIHNTPIDVDPRAIANAFIRAERTGLVRNSRIGVYLRGRQAHRRWLAVWLSAALGATYDDAEAYARRTIDREPL